MTTEPAARIAAILREHARRVDFNHPAYGLCRCGFDPDGDWPEHAADWPEHAAAKVAGALAPDIDKVAEAIWQGYHGSHRAPYWEDLPESSRARYRRMARAAVTAMGFATEEQP
jgi:hypothetical protein